MLQMARGKLQPRGKRGRSEVDMRRRNRDEESFIPSYLLNREKRVTGKQTERKDIRTAF